MAEFDYDVAISFLGDDEDIALRLADVLRERTSVFMLSEQEKEAAGHPGLETSAALMRGRARVCVVLFRDPWGQTSWTRMDAAAMKERGLEEGWDFLFVIALDPASGRSAPVWVPKSNVWTDYDRYGVQAAAAVIEHKVRELGGEPRVETALEQGERLQREEEAERERDEFLNSESGVEAAQKELARMFALFKSETDAMRWSKSPSDIYAECRQRQCALRTSRAGVAVLWQLSYGNTLHLSGLTVRLYTRAVHLDGQYRGGEKDPVAEENFAFTRTLDGRLGWSSWGDPGRVWTTEQFVQKVLKRLLDQSHDPGLRDDAARRPNLEVKRPYDSGSSAPRNDIRDDRR
jgi:hypothetical protein